MAKKKAKPRRPESEPSEPFEESLARLEGIVESLEAGELGLADSLALYEEGVQRLRQCHEQLEAAERRIELLAGVDAEGNPVTQPFDDTATAEAPRSRSAKRTTKPAQNPSEEGVGGVDDETRLF